MTAAKPPTNKQVLAHNAQFPPSDTYQCSYCLKSSQGYYCHPVHPYFVANNPNYNIETMDGKPWPDSEPVFCCSECHNKKYYEGKARRKQQLAEEPRCEVSPCTRRGSFRARGVLLCGAHLKRARNGLARIQAQSGGLALFLPIDFNRADILQWAKGE